MWVALLGDPTAAQRQRVPWGKEPQRNGRAFAAGGSEGYGACGDEDLVAPALFPAFLLPQVIPPRLLRLALLSGDLLPLGLLLLPLELDGLLGPGARPGGPGAAPSWG